MNIASEGVPVTGCYKRGVQGRAAWGQRGRMGPLLHNDRGLLVAIAARHLQIVRFRTLLGLRCACRANNAAPLRQGHPALRSLRNMSIAAAACSQLRLTSQAPAARRAGRPTRVCAPRCQQRSGPPRLPLALC